HTATYFPSYLPSDACAPHFHYTTLFRSQKQALAALRQQIAARQNQLTETEYSLRQLPTVMAQKIQSLRNDLAATEQRIAEINGRDRKSTRLNSSHHSM